LADKLISPPKRVIGPANVLDALTFRVAVLPALPHTKPEFDVRVNQSRLIALEKEVLKGSIFTNPEF
jgi:hypothetical protein